MPTMCGRLLSSLNCYLQAPSDIVWLLCASMQWAEYIFNLSFDIEKLNLADLLPLGS